jgi:uncharacterized membrane protein
MSNDSFGAVARESPPGGARTALTRLRSVPREISRNLPSVVIYLSTLAFTLATVYTALFKYFTFNDTFEDLGINNETQWLLAHGGVRNYFSSGFSNIYPFQWQKPFTFVILAVYALAPSPPTLIILQSIAIGLAAIPLYYLARKLIGPGWIPVIIASAYLVYFPLSSASLFDFEYENFTPLLYLSMTLAWESGHRRSACVLAVVCAGINPLVLVLVIFFLVYTLIRELDWGQQLGAIVRTSVRKTLEVPWRLFTVLLLLGLLVLYQGLGSLYTAGAGSTVPGLGPIAILSFDINDKLTFLLFLLGAVAFLPLFYRWFLWLAAPYIAWVLYSTDGSHWATFGLMYPMMAAGAIFFSLVYACRGAKTFWEESAAPTGSSPSYPPGAADRATDPVPALDHYIAARVSSPSPADPPAPPRRPRWRLTPESRPVAVLVLVSVVFALIYLPWSPYNQDVAGGYFSGNHAYSSITDLTPADQFLWKVVGLIPSNGSVLTQNGIPQISGREHVQIDTLYNPAIPFNYILADSGVTTFSSITTIEPFINATLQNGTSGILAEGDGAILTERGYSGPPTLYLPYFENLTATSLVAYGGTSTVGTSFVRSTAGFSMWYGPYATLYPGNYSATYTLATNTTSNGPQPLLTLDVISNGGSRSYAETALDESAFARANEPTAFTLDFHLAQTVSGLEFRGMFPTGAASLTLFGVTVQQLSYR